MITKRLARLTVLALAGTGIKPIGACLHNLILAKPGIEPAKEHKFEFIGRRPCYDSVTFFKRAKTLPGRLQSFHQLHPVGRIFGGDAFFYRPIAERFDIHQVAVGRDDGDPFGLQIIPFLADGRRDLGQGSPINILPEH